MIRLIVVLRMQATASADSYVIRYHHGPVKKRNRRPQVPTMHIDHLEDQNLPTAKG